MNTEVFLNWYDNTFITGVKRFQKRFGKRKYGTFLDVALSHPSIELLNRENGYFTVSFLPHNVTPILQPMN